MEEIKKYKITLKHDNGKVNIITTASDEKQAREIVLKWEGAPACAIVKVKQLKPLKTYKQKKAEARQKAIETQAEASEKNLSWWDCCHLSQYFESIAKRYGLIKEFKKNGLI